MTRAYAVLFVKSARREFEQLPAKIQTRVHEALQLLSTNPLSDLLRVKKLKATDALYRIRVSDYRLVYEIRNATLVVLVIKIGHRRDVYRRL